MMNESLQSDHIKEIDEPTFTISIKSD